MWSPLILILAASQTWALPNNLIRDSSGSAVDVTNNSAQHTFNDTSLTQTSVPEDFHLVITPYSERPLPVTTLYFSLLRFTSIAAGRSFTAVATPFSETSGAVTIDFTEVRNRVTSSRDVGRGQPGDLLNSHIVWALQRLAENIYATRRYQELRGEIRSEGTIVGKLTLRLAAQDVTSSMLGAGANSTEQRIDTGRDLRNLTESSYGNLDLPSRSNDVSFEVRLKTLAIPRIATFLTFIRGVAEIASNDFQRFAADTWQHVDEEFGLSIVYERNTAAPKIVKWSDLILSFLTLFTRWQTRRAFVEAEGSYKVDGRSTSLAEIRIQKISSADETRSVMTY